MSGTAVNSLSRDLECVGIVDIQPYFGQIVPLHFADCVRKVRQEYPTALIAGKRGQGLKESPAP